MSSLKFALVLSVVWSLASVGYADGFSDVCTGVTTPFCSGTGEVCAMSFNTRFSFNLPTYAARQQAIFQRVCDNQPDVIGLQEAFNGLMTFVGINPDGSLFVIPDPAVPDLLAFFTPSGGNPIYELIDFDPFVEVDPDDPPACQARQPDPILIRSDRFEVIAQGRVRSGVTVAFVMLHCTHAGVNWVRLRDLTSGREFVVYNTHFPGPAVPKTTNAVVLAELLAAHRLEHGLPSIVLGDLNANESNPNLKFLKGLQSIDDQRCPEPEDCPVTTSVPLMDTWRVNHPTDPEPSTFSMLNKKKIDHVLTTRVPAMTVVESRIDSGPGGIDADGIFAWSGSDHLPVLARLVIPTPDLDGDGVNDAVDNCIEVANADQLDTDNDLYGNLCDGDFDGDDIANMVDFNMYLIPQFGNDCNFDPTLTCSADLSGDNIVGLPDFVIWITRYNLAPGPSGFHP